jgi:diguanylate cyclase (GGDEF)-like protein
MALLMIDIDFFKPYNDLYGHPGGDACLQRVAQAIRSAVHRPADLAARYGGEEFAVLLPETDASGARFLALHVLQTVEALRIPHAGSSVAGHVTLSIGVAAWDRPPVSAAAAPGAPWPPVAQLLTAADQALYAAKQAGRRQVCYLAAEDAGHPQRALELQRAELGAVFELGALAPANR